MEKSELKFEDIYLQMADKNSSQNKKLLSESMSNEEKSISSNMYNCLLEYCCFFL